MSCLLLLSALLCLTLASPAPAGSKPICSQSCHATLNPVAKYGPAQSYCERHYPVAAVTQTTTYTPTQRQLHVVTVANTVYPLQTEIVTQSVTITVGTTFLDKREAAAAATPLPYASLSKYWSSVSSALSCKGSAAFSTACSCMQTPKTVKQTMTAKDAVVVQVISTKTSLTTTTVVVDKTATLTTDAIATVSPGPGSCSNIQSPYVDASSPSFDTYDTFCKQALSAASTIYTLADIADFKSCISKCSSTTGCLALNYVRSTQTCTLLSDNSGTTSTSDGIDCAKMDSTGSFATLALDSTGEYHPPGSTLAFTVATDKIYTYEQSDLLSSAFTSNFADCIDQCAAATQCEMVSRSRSSGTCLAFNKVLTEADSTTSKLRARQSTNTTPPNSDSGTLVNPIDPASCQALNSAPNSLLTSNGKTFIMDCNAFTPMTPGYGLAGVTNLQKCADYCATTSGCIAANYNRVQLTCTPTTTVTEDFSQVSDSNDDASQIDAIRLSTYVLPSTSSSSSS
ncbi:hypothetical protein DOTSEDRAFT_67417 [Dothistroma septosporum NZE10]|uniref:Apple domain-containing protein n=1 Tax=Dothistroma septosporum (strain NZE10 / CBS 128990) TaxID=675120 RepID=N1PXS3_DOTSN|nr:hypothetical protein DOTSEDRAFT_67417 [Dothistroma septosporum NZE10]